jgi:hypothetical protein
MRAQAWVRVAAVAGALFFVLIVVQGPVLSSGPPALTDSTQKVYAYFSAHHSHLKLAAACYALAMSAILCWLPAFYGVLRRAMDEFAGLALGAAAGIVLAAAMSVSTAAIEATIACRFGEIDPSLTRVLYTLQQFTQGGILFGLLVAVGLAGVVSLQTGLFGRWFALSSLVLAVVSLAGGSAIAYANSTAQTLAAIGLSLDSLWVLAVSVLIYRRPALALSATA